MILFLLLFIIPIIIWLKSSKNQNDKIRQSEKLKNNSNQITSDWIPKGASEPRNSNKQKSSSKVFGKGLLVTIFLLLTIAIIGNNLENNQNQISQDTDNGKKSEHKESEPQKIKPIKQAEISEYALKPYSSYGLSKKIRETKISMGRNE